MLQRSNHITTRASLNPVVGSAPRLNLHRLPSGGRVQRGRSPLWWGSGGTPQPHIHSASRQGSEGTSGGGHGRTPTRSRGAPTNTEPELLVDLAEMGGETADPPRFQIGARATRKTSRPAGVSREGAALFGGGLGEPPNPISAPLPAREVGGPPGPRTGAQPCAPPNTGPELLVDQAEMGGETADPPRFRIGVRASRRASRPTGESREGAALFGGGLGERPNPISAPLPAREVGGPPGPRTGAQPCAPPNTGPELLVDQAEMGGETADPPRFRIGVRASRRASRPTGESREGAALFGGGLGERPNPISAPLPAREVSGPPGPGTGAQPCAPTNTEPKPEGRTEYRRRGGVAKSGM